MIDSPSNPTIKGLRNLTTLKGRRETGAFLVEGVRAVDDGLKAGQRPRVCLYNYELVSRTERGRILLRQLQELQDQGVILTEASQRALEAASDTVHPQGIVASFPIQDPAITTSSEGRALCLICDQVQDPGNLGTILRSAEAAGATGVWLSEGCADVYNPKVVRAAMGAHFRLPIFSEATWDSLATELAGRSVELTRVFATEAGADDWYDQVDWAGPAALIVSNEAHGLSDQARNMAGNLISIPMVGGAESLNAAVAASIVLFEAARQRRTLSTLLQGGTSSE